MMNEKSVIFYITIMILASILGAIYQYLKKCNIKILAYISYIISFLIVWIVSAMRFGIGTDYFMYRDIYEYALKGATIPQIIQRYDVEPGWATLNHILSLIFKEPQYIFIVTSFIFIFCIYKVIIEFEDRVNVGLAIFIFLSVSYIPSFNVIRQYLAIGILMLSLKYIEQKKIIKFIIFVIMASLFHYTALIFLPIYYLLNHNIGIFKLIGIFMAVFIGFINYNNIIRVITTVIPSFEKYSRYVSTGNIEINKTLLIMQFAIVFFILISYKFLKKNDLFMYRMTYVYFASIVFSLLGNIATFVGRTAYYLDISQMIFIPFICRYGIKGKNKIVVNTIIIMYFMSYWFINFVYSGNNGCIPYISI